MAPGCISKSGRRSRWTGRRLAPNVSQLARADRENRPSLRQRPRGSTVPLNTQNSGSHRESHRLSLHKAFVRSLTCATRAMAVRATAPSHRSRRIDVEQSEASAGRPAGSGASRRAEGSARSMEVAGFRGRRVVTRSHGGRMGTAATSVVRLSRSLRRGSPFRRSHRS